MSDFEVAEELSLNKSILPERVGQMKDLLQMESGSGITAGIAVQV
jgi:hypothetical protein